MELLDRENMANVEKQENIEGESLIKRKKKKKLGGLKTMPFILGMFTSIFLFLLFSLTTFFAYFCFWLGLTSSRISQLVRIQP